MALPSITLRNTKGSALTYTEHDNNFSNLQAATIGVVVGSTTTSLALNDQLTLAAGANVTLTANSGTKTVTITAASGSGITDVVQDTTPQLGGDLDINGKKIVSTSNAPIYIEPNGTGDVYLTADQTVFGDLNSNATITTYGAGDLILNTDSGNNSGSITIADGANGNITIVPNGTGNLVLDGQNWPQTAGTANYFLKTDGAGQTSWSALPSVNTATGAVVGGIKVGSNLTITGDGTLSATATPYTLTSATAAVLGGVKIGSNVNIDSSGVISVAAPYSLNTATASVLGGIKIGANLTITGDGTLSATASGGSTGVTSITFGSTGLTPSSATTGTVTVGGVLNVANGGLGTSEVASAGMIPVSNGSNYFPRWLTAGSNITITTSSSAITIAASSGGASAETVYAYTFSATFAPNWTNGTIQTTTITANITSLAFTSPATGQTITIVATQGGSGSYTLPASSSTLKYANGTRALSTAVGAIDLITISYIGTVYYVSISRGYA